ncbi:MAG: ROK family protein [Casimicrobiaceae bacterium]
MLRMGIDLGGTKIEGIILAPDGSVCWSARIPTPRGTAAGIVEAIANLVAEGERAVGASCTVGVGTPGSLSPQTRLLRGSNSVELNGCALDQLLSERLARPVRIANDANCFALSEATDGAGKGAGSVFGVILGTGVGGGLVIDGRVVVGRHAIAGEWGHNPLPWMTPEELAEASDCYCGKRGCIETWLSGPGIAQHAARRLGRLDSRALVARAQAGDEAAAAELARVADRLARALASVINVFDPEIIVLGGGVSNIELLYPAVRARLPQYVFSDYCDTPIVRHRHGDASGVRGAAWLWAAQNGERQL